MLLLAFPETENKLVLWEIKVTAVRVSCSLMTPCNHQFKADVSSQFAKDSHKRALVKIDADLICAFLSFTAPKKQKKISLASFL